MDRHETQAVASGVSVNIDELLVECLDALGTCNNNRDEHRRLIDLALLTNGLPANVREALVRLDHKFHLYRTGHPWCMFSSMDGRENFHREIRQLISPMTLTVYAYHGTTVGRLKGIWADGLCPGEIPVWKGNDEHSMLVRKNSDSGVFFSDTWRSAMHTWAFAAHMHSRGPKNGLKRTPAVIRIKASSVHIEVDPAATCPSWMVKGKVPVVDAEVICGFDTDFPRWMPLETAAMSLKS